MADDQLSEITKKCKMRKSIATVSRENGSSCDKPKPKSAFLQWFSDNFSKDTFRNESDRCREQIDNTITEQLRRAQATIGQMRDIDRQLGRLDRELGFLNMKCRTYYNRIAFNNELQKHADQVLSSFDLSLGKTIDEAVSEAPPLLKDSVRLFQTRWRKAMATSKWQQDLDKARETLTSTLESYKKCELELEAKRIQLEIYEKIRGIKEDLEGMSDTEKLQKIKGTIEEVLSHPPIKYESDAKNDDSSEFINSTDSDDNSPLNHKL